MPAPAFDPSKPFEVATFDPSKPFDVTSTKSSPDETAAPSASFLPGPTEFLQRVGDAMVDVPVGMVKQAGRYVQAVPGVAAATDALYGLPAGASKASMQPTNPSQTAGGYLTDLAVAAGTAGAEAGPAIGGKAVGYVSNPTVAQRAIASGQKAADFGGDVASLLKAKLSTGPLTADKVAGLITTYGKTAVKLALSGTLGMGALKAFGHLL